MSFVGPRPELPLYVSSYTAEQRKVLSVRPGITDPASLAYRHEEQLLASANDLEAFYREVVLPDKLRLNLEYIQNISFFFDSKLIVTTLGVLPRPKAVTSIEMFPGSRRHGALDKY
jgi:lipopolysaccharide/colanic/teichoic acid biosynthesis glycosyltransferase